jgi:hypothetical protein
MVATLLEPARVQRRRVRLRPSRRRVVGTVLLAVALAGAAVAAVVTSGGEGAARRVAASAPTGFEVVDAYHVTYAVTAPNAPPGTEQLWVRRPFDSVDVTTSAAARGGAATLTIVNRLGAQVLALQNAQPTLLRVPAAVAPHDVRADLVVPEGLRAHRLRRIGAATVLRRGCTVYRSAAPLHSGPLRPLSAAGPFTDTCIDGQGVVLRETTVDHGHVTNERVATSVQVGPAAVEHAAFAMSGAPTPFDAGGGAFTQLTFTSRPPGGSWALRPPVGLRWVGRFAVVPPQPEAFGRVDAGGLASPALPGSLVSELDDVYTHGSDVVVVQQGSTIGGATFRAPSGAAAVDLGRLGAGQVTVAGNAVTVSAEPGNGRRFIRVTGTLPVGAVVALARALESQPAGTLVRLGAKGSS